MRSLTRAQARQIDQLAVERYQMPSILLMENAARGVAVVADAMLGKAAGGDGVLILCGGGNNGGDGLAAARHLHNRGYRVQIGLTGDPATYRGDALINWNIIRAMNLPAGSLDVARLKDDRPALVIDAIFGTGLDRPPRQPFPAIAQAINDAGIPVLAVDLPSGMDCDTGLPLGACIRATRTVTFVAPKAGFLAASSRELTGDVVVADIGCPREIFDGIENGG
jgi:NAD(P)H-hydrate epimerase